MNAPEKIITLHAIIDAYARALDTIDYDSGEIAPDVSALLDELAPALELKLEALAGARARLIADADANDRLAKQYHARSVGLGRNVDRLEAYALRCLQEAKLLRVKAPTATVWLAETKSVSVLCKPEDLPEQYQRVKPATVAPDKKALHDALEAGELIAGVEIETSTGIRWR